MNNPSTIRRIFAISILLGICLLFTSPAAATFSGSGTADDPYLIQSNTDMKQFAELVNAGDAEYCAAHYLLTTDLALEDEEWVPIGLSPKVISMTISFEGVFDGNGKTISYSIEKPAGHFAGLFGCNSGTIKNLNVKCSISGVYGEIVLYAGGICAMNLQGTIENCVISANIDVVSTTTYAGGVAGYDSGGLIQGCSIEGEIFAESLSEDVGVGGIVGETFGTVADCNADGTVYASGEESVYAGGVAGSNMMEAISSCTSSVDVTAYGTSDDMYAGGIVGQNHGVVTDCTVTRSGITATCYGEGWTYSYAGGIAARNYAEIMDCESTADISATATSIPADDNDNWPQVLVGGIAGSNDGTIQNCISRGLVSGEAEGEVFSGDITGVNDGTVVKSSAEDAPADDYTPSDDAAESPAPLAGILLGGLCAVFLRRK